MGVTRLSDQQPISVQNKTVTSTFKALTHVCQVQAAQRKGVTSYKHWLCCHPEHFHELSIAKASWRQRSLGSISIASQNPNWVLKLKDIIIFERQWASMSWTWLIKQSSGFIHNTFSEQTQNTLCHLLANLIHYICSCFISCHQSSSTSHVQERLPLPYLPASPTTFLTSASSKHRSWHHILYIPC